VLRRHRSGSRHRTRGSARSRRHARAGAAAGVRRRRNHRRPTHKRRCGRVTPHYPLATHATWPVRPHHHKQRGGGGGGRGAGGGGCTARVRSARDAGRCQHRRLPRRAPDNHRNQHALRMPGGLEAEERAIRRQGGAAATNLRWQAGHRRGHDGADRAARQATWHGEGGAPIQTEDRRRARPCRQQGSRRRRGVRPNGGTAGVDRSAVCRRRRHSSSTNSGARLAPPARLPGGARCRSRVVPASGAAATVPSSREGGLAAAGAPSARTVSAGSAGAAPRGGLGGEKIGETGWSDNAAPAAAPPPR